MGRTLLPLAPASRRWSWLREPAPLWLLTHRRSYPWLVVGTTCIAAFIGQVDASIVQLALPDLERAFGAHLDTVCWVVIAYVLAFAAALPVFARLAENGGRKLMYMLGFFGFGVWSALCGLAPGIDWLIGFRVLQGISGAMLGPTASSSWSPLRDRRGGGRQWGSSPRRRRSVSAPGRCSVDCCSVR